MKNGDEVFLICCNGCWTGKRLTLSRRNQDVLFFDEGIIHCDSVLKLWGGRMVFDKKRERISGLYI